jgi:hypothetical protein
LIRHEAAFRHFAAGSVPIFCRVRQLKDCVLTNLFSLSGSVVAATRNVYISP